MPKLFGNLNTRLVLSRSNSALWLMSTSPHMLQETCQNEQKTSTWRGVPTRCRCLPQRYRRHDCGRHSVILISVTSREALTNKLSAASLSCLVTLHDYTQANNPLFPYLSEPRWCGALGHGDTIVTQPLAVSRQHDNIDTFIDSSPVSRRLKFSYRLLFLRHAC